MEVSSDVTRVYEVFKDFFGENFVDLQEGDDHKKFILVYWPRVRVTNENDKYIDITDLYAKIRLNNDGTIPWEDRGFLLNRTSYDMDQFDRGYMHSHISGIPTGNFTTFMSPCLGQGPLNNTIHTLKNDSDSLNWMLFCQELSMYVTVESLHGIPYIKLETVGSSFRGNRIYDFTDPYSYSVRTFDSLFNRYYGQHSLKDFYLWYLEKGHLKISYREGRFIQGMRLYDFVLDISNSFIDWVNVKHSEEDPNWLYAENALSYYTVENGVFHQYSDEPRRRRNYSSYQGAYVLTFKGEEKHLVITDRASNNENNLVKILNPTIAMAILQIILININLKYGRKREEAEGREDSAANSDKKRAYI